MKSKVLKSTLCQHRFSRKENKNTTAHLGPFPANLEKMYISARDMIMAAGAARGMMINGQVVIDIAVS